MGTKRTASIRINASILDQIKEEAKQANRSFSNYVETLLVGLGYGAKNTTDNPSETRPHSAPLTPEGHRAIQQALDEVKKGKVYSMRADETLEDFISRMETEGNV